MQTVEVEEVTQDGDVHSVKTTHRIGDKVRPDMLSVPEWQLQLVRVYLQGPLWPRGTSF